MTIKPEMKMVGFRADDEMRERLSKMDRGDKSYFIRQAILEKWQRELRARSRKRSNGKESK